MDIYVEWEGKRGYLIETFEKSGIRYGLVINSKGEFCTVDIQLLRATEYEMKRF